MISRSDSRYCRSVLSMLGVSSYLIATAGRLPLCSSRMRLKSKDFGSNPRSLSVSRLEHNLFIRTVGIVLKTFNVDNKCCSRLHCNFTYYLPNFFPLSTCGRGPCIKIVTKIHFRNVSKMLIVQALCKRTQDRSFQQRLPWGLALSLTREEDIYGG